MKKILLGGNFYKANLHCHTNCSDGRLSPEQVKEAYKKEGYSAVAFTDHDIYLDHTDLSDPDFVALKGYEIGMTEDVSPFTYAKCCHICFIALDENVKHPAALHRTKYMSAHVAERINEVDFGDMEDFEHEYTPACVNDAIRRGKEAGFFISYNHPTWSMETFAEYGAYEGMDALEMYNGSCTVGGFPDYNSHAYDDLLRQGKYIAVTGSDDNHNHSPLGDPHSDSFVAFTMINADELSYKGLGDALRAKKFYASDGAYIKSVYVEDGVLHVEAEPCRSINFTTGVRVAYLATDGFDKTITHASFRLRDDLRYVRATVTDVYGRTASTRAYTIDELLNP